MEQYHVSYSKAIDIVNHDFHGLCGQVKGNEFDQKRGVVGAIGTYNDTTRKKGRRYFVIYQETSGRIRWTRFRYHYISHSWEEWWDGDVDQNVFQDPVWKHAILCIIN